MLMCQLGAKSPAALTETLSNSHSLWKRQNRAMASSGLIEQQLCTLAPKWAANILPGGFGPLPNQIIRERLLPTERAVIEKRSVTLLELPKDIRAEIDPTVAEERAPPDVSSIVDAGNNIDHNCLAQLFSTFGGVLKYISEDDTGHRTTTQIFILSDVVLYPRSAICSVTICVRSGFFRPCSSSLNLSTLLDQFMLQNFGPHMLQNAASL